MYNFRWLHRKLIPQHIVQIYVRAKHNNKMVDGLWESASTASDKRLKSAHKIMAKKGIKFTDYHCLGFDLDNTVCRFKIGSMVKLEYETLSHYLVTKKGYSPKFLSKPIENNVDFMLKGLIIDVEKGNILRIAPDGHILHGSHGTSHLTRDDLIKYYGTECRWQITDAFSKDPLHTWNGPFSEKMRTLLDYFDMPAGLVFARAVDTLDEAYGGPLQSYLIWPDLLEAIQDMFQKEHFQLNKGGYFEQMKAQPENFIHKCSDELVNWFQEMKKRDKLLFLVTGSNVDFASHSASNSIGENWQELFDIVICFAKKPGFFTLNRPFIGLNGFEEVGPVEVKDLKRGDIYTYGNWNGLHEFLKKYTCEDPKVVYFGDNLVQDIYTPSVHTSCDTVAICEELHAEGAFGHDCDHNDRHFLTSSSWGSYFSHGDENKETIWLDIISKHSKACIPSLEYVAKKPIDYEYVHICSN